MAIRKLNYPGNVLRLPGMVVSHKNKYTVRVWGSGGGQRRQRAFARLSIDSQRRTWTVGLKNLRALGSLSFTEHPGS
eukprot:687448-Pyramimonas_sp.AAC.1